MPLLAAAAVAVPCATFGALLGSILVAVGGSRESSLSFLATSTVTTTSLSLWLVFGGGGVAAAVAASAVGGASALVLVILGLRRRSVRLRPRRDWTYVRRALRYGALVQAGVVLSALAARMDLLIVYRLLGDQAAGAYSVALTMTVLATAPASAVSYGAFPRMSGADAATALPLVQRTLRAGLVVTGLSMPPLLLAAVVGIPLAFGEEYASAVVPGVLLTLAGALSGVLFLVARLAAARGRASVLPRASLAYLAVVVGGDLALVPIFGIRGAAAAAVLGAAAAAVVAVRALEALVPGSLSRELWPRSSDLLELARLPGSMASTALRARRSSNRQGDASP